MIDFFEEAFENMGFWLLFGGGTIAVLIGWIFSKKISEFSFPFWQVAIIIVIIFFASAFFSTRE